MAEVYRADQELAPGIYRPAALKVIRPEYSESEDFREMFLDEARTACTLSHPNIVHIYEVGEVDGLIYMGMELVAGESLSTVARTLWDRGDRLPPEALLAIGVFTCSALEAVHALELPGEGHLRLVHRDVSPHNLLLSSKGSLKLIDFGIAKAATNRNLTAAGVTKGKAGYFSPEQAMGKVLDGRSDLFSLGVTLYKLASGVTPFERFTTHKDRNGALVAGKWEPLEKVAPGLMPGFYDVVRNAMQLKPQDRYANATQMREALEQVAFDGGINIGPAALSGFVEEKNGLVSVATTISKVSGLQRASGKHRRITPVSTPAAEAPKEPTTDPHAAAAPKRRALMVSSIAGLVVLAVAGAIIFQRSEPPPPPPGPVPVQVAKAPEPTPPVPTPIAAAEPAQVPEAEEPVELTPPRGSAPEERKPKSPRSSSERGEPRARPQKESSESIPEGTGQLRINSSPPGEVRVAGVNRGETPVGLKLRSGSYQVELSLPTLQKRKVCSVKVLPDKTARLRYDAKDDRCAFDFL